MTLPSTARVIGSLSGLALLVYTLSSLAGDAPRRHYGIIEAVADDTIYFCNSHYCFQVGLASVRSSEQEFCVPSGKISALGYVSLDKKFDYSPLDVVGEARCSSPY